MEEVNRTIERRAGEWVFVRRYLTGSGIDIGPDRCPLRERHHLFPGMTNLLWWNTSLGGESHMAGQSDASFDFVHASVCLAAQDNPAQSLSRWLDLLKPGGHLLVTVPPNDDSALKWRFTIGKPAKASSQSIDILDLAQSVSHVAQCERLVLVRDDIADAAPESAIELIMRKRDIASPRDYAMAMIAAENARACIAACEEAIAAYPYRVEVILYAKAELLRWREPERVDALLARCVERMPNDHLIHLRLALHTIARGRLNEGFALRESLAEQFGWERRTKAQPPTGIAKWNGEPLAGKRIVIWSEFGLGDEVFFFRFARILRERAGAASVGVVCQTPLVSLFEASGEAAVVIDVKAADVLPAFDYWVYPHAIPVFLPLDLEALPQSVPYLRAPCFGVPGMPQVHESAVKVGVVFKGEPSHENDAARSLPSLSVLDDLFAIDGAEFFSLQKGEGAREAAGYAARLGNFHDVGVLLTSMADTASAIAALDVVVTVDTSVAHVAGALGKPVWLMLPADGDWRWHYYREDSPWYPTMRLLRRPSHADWSEVVACIGAGLVEWAAKRRADGR